jgi:hypothetical protein
MEEKNRRKQHINQTEEAMREAVEDALQTLPLFEPPAGLYQNVMTSIQPSPLVERPVFRLSWMDFALSMFFAGMIGLAMLLSDWLPPELRMLFTHQLSLFELQQLNWVLWAALGTSAAACLAACAVFSGLQMNRASR